MNNETLRPLIVWFILTVVYGVTLIIFQDFIMLSLGYHIGLLLIVIYFARKGLREGLSLRKGSNVGYGILIVAFLAGVLTIRLFLTKSSLNLGWDLLTFMSIFFIPVTEELFWRGFILQKMFADARLGNVYSIIVNALFFAAMHIPRIIFFNMGIASFGFYALYGIYIALMYYLTKSTYYPTAVHAILNIFAPGP